MYLLENSPEAVAMRQNVVRLLESNQKENIDLALQLIESGGLHDDVENALLELYAFDAFELEEILKLPAFMLRVIQCVKIHYVKLKHLPEIIFQCPRLRILQTYETNFMGISDKIADLQHLEVVSFAYDKISEIPEALLSLPKLKDITFSHNKLTALPAYIKKATKLQSLFAESNKLTTLPEEIGEIKELLHLLLNGNKLIDLPENLWNLPKLKTFRAEYNQLTALSESVGKATALENLQITVNNLKTLPAAIVQLRKLKRLDARPRKGTLKLTDEQVEFLKYVSNDLGRVWETYRHEDDFDNDITKL
jgi:Leucine-rich repeat (LRR) protein